MYKILANTIFLGKDVHFLPECHSTNDIALNLVRQRQASEGSVVICGHQTKGKGQRGNLWQSQSGQNLTFSLVLRPDFMDISEQFYLNMAVSNSIRRLLQDYVPHLEVKWPNDLIVPSYGKIGGILIENTFSGKEWEYAIIGIGLNINQLGFESPNAASIRSITGSQFELEELFRLLITQLEQGYIQLKKNKWNEIKAEYIMHLYRRDMWVNYLANGEQFLGKIVGINAAGKLELELENGEISFFALKEISFL
jgi:BirA family biotin operon repressor/biotin-[acetyl-CoA-carboxylase] ligase